MARAPRQEGETRKGGTPPLTPDTGNLETPETNQMNTLHIAHHALVQGTHQGGLVAVALVCASWLMGWAIERFDFNEPNIMGDAS